MRRTKRHYDEWADRLAAGIRDPHDEETVTAFVDGLRTDTATSETTQRLAASLAAETLSVAEVVPIRKTAGREVRPLTTRWRQRAMISTFLSTLFGKIVLGAATVAVAASGAAATGTLPDPVQQKVADALSEVGVEIPSPDKTSEESIESSDVSSDDTNVSNETDVSRETSAPVLPEQASDTARAVHGEIFRSDAATGRAFGEAVSGAARDGKPDAPAASKQPSTPPAASKKPSTPPAGSKKQSTPPAASKKPSTPPAGSKKPTTPAPKAEAPVTSEQSDKGTSRRP